MIVSLSLIGLILLKDEELKDLNSQIELIPIDSNVSGVVHNNKNLVLETDNKIIKDPVVKDSVVKISDDNDLMDGDLE